MKCRPEFGRQIGGISDCLATAVVDEKVEVMSAADADVIRAVLAGDRSSFGELYKRHARWVRAVLYDACGDLTQAQDLTQEVFLRAFRGLGNLRDQNRFGPWLMGIARTVGMDWRRCRAVDRHQYIGCAFDCPAQPGSRADDESIQQLRRAISSLPERERLAVYVFYLQARSVDDARTVLDMSRAGFYRLLRRARRRLERLIHREEHVR
jgi:RNA polymerase sigma factor (sigma-70 family)